MISIITGAIAQRLERLAYTENVYGSNPYSPKNFNSEQLPQNTIIFCSHRVIPCFKKYIIDFAIYKLYQNILIYFL